MADLSKTNALVEGSRQFDAITLFQVIEHLESPDLVFEQLSRLAAPGATLMLGCPSFRRYTRAFPHPDRIGSSDFWDCPPQHSLRWTPAALEAFTARHGWAVRHVILNRQTPFTPPRILPVCRITPRSGPAGRPLLNYRIRLRLGCATGVRLYFRATRVIPSFKSPGKAEQSTS